MVVVFVWISNATRHPRHIETAAIFMLMHLYSLVVIYRVFNYLKHHVYNVSINSFIYYVSKNNFMELHVYNYMLFMSLSQD